MFFPKPNVENPTVELRPFKEIVLDPVEAIRLSST